VLGATPGCLGAFAVVAMYSHGAVTLGAVVTAMIATSGDEAFVMLALIPKQALVVTGILFVLGIVSGALTDLVHRRLTTWQERPSDRFEAHEEEHCQCFPRGRILRQWRECSAARGILSAGLVLFVGALTTGQMGPTEWNWLRVTLLLVSGIAFFIVVTVPDHFLEEHLWRHVAMKHVPRIFAWTLGSLIAMYVLTEQLELDATIREGKWLVLLVAGLVGLIPESGPHLIFVTLYVQGSIPLSVLLASSIVQDGHGMLPVLAHSKRAFLGIKLVNLIVGMLIGLVTMAVGY
jgi:hypothetical protein